MGCIAPARNTHTTPLPQGARGAVRQNRTDTPAVRASVLTRLVTEVPGTAPAGVTKGPVIEFWKAWKYDADSASASLSLYDAPR